MLRGSTRENSGAGAGADHIRDALNSDLSHGREIDRELLGIWRPNVIKFSQNLLEDIRPRAMTRDIDWGIPVSGWEDQPSKRLYVWFDAVVGYLSASIEWARRSGDPEAWRQWWNDPQALSYYFMEFLSVSND